MEVSIETRTPRRADGTIIYHSWANYHSTGQHQSQTWQAAQLKYRNRGIQA